ncbi:anthrone oxygenase family protein [Streptomyces cinerochromogenes]|uniref:anthrone oxygenase family protein n=1 Tax=Streptomyces cinerochromogenes TaxID=66422 RepID=UPI001E48AD5D|nr:anthrone oxygenase family protein [Streptomyces cinerochromogenes]
MLTGTVLVGTGTVTGIFVAVAVSVAPAMAAMERADYLRAHALLGKGYHPLMPILVNVVTLSGFALAWLAGPPARWLFPLASALLIGVQAVSHLGNVPINRSLGALAADGPWQDPRPLWRAWHRLRTALALLALLTDTVAVLAAR